MPASPKVTGYEGDLGKSQKIGSITKSSENPMTPISTNYLNNITNSAYTFNSIQTSASQQSENISSSSIDLGAMKRMKFSVDELNGAEQSMVSGGSDSSKELNYMQCRDEIPYSAAGPINQQNLSRLPLAKGKIIAINIINPSIITANVSSQHNHNNHIINNTKLIDGSLTVSNHSTTSTNQNNIINLMVTTNESVKHKTENVAINDDHIKIIQIADKRNDNACLKEILNNDINVIKHPQISCTASLAIVKSSSKSSPLLLSPSCATTKNTTTITSLSSQSIQSPIFKSFVCNDNKSSDVNCPNTVLKFNVSGSGQETVSSSPSSSIVTSVSSNTSSSTPVIVTAITPSTGNSAIGSSVASVTSTTASSTTATGFFVLTQATLNELLNSGSLIDTTQKVVCGPNSVTVTPLGKVAEDQPLSSSGSVTSSSVTNTDSMSLKPIVTITNPTNSNTKCNTLITSTNNSCQKSILMINTSGLINNCSAGGISVAASQAPIGPLPATSLFSQKSLGGQKPMMFTVNNGQQVCF